MPTGPNGEKRPADDIACAVTVMQIATGQIEETNPARSNAGRARARALTPERRSEIARAAARARWDKVKQAS